MSLFFGIHPKRARRLCEYQLPIAPMKIEDHYELSCLIEQFLNSKGHVLNPRGGSFYYINATNQIVFSSPTLVSLTPVRYEQQFISYSFQDYYDWLARGSFSMDPAPSLPEKVEGNPYCWCVKCYPTWDRMITCPNCGNKRCPRASDHAFSCTNSNEPNQPGSVYGGVPA